MSRVDAVRIALEKYSALADSARDGGSPPGAGARVSAGMAMASDAFFPFPDGLEVVVGAGATAVIQPGGSVRDDEVTAAADRLRIAMVFTGMRHFRH